jgi:hypothetical protein
VLSGGATASPVFGSVGDTDQRSKIGTYNIAPTYTRILSKNAVLNFGAFVRHDGYNYYPSHNPLADLGPIQSQSISQNRTLLNAGAHAELTIQKGINNIKAGAMYEHTFLREHDNLGVVNATFNSPCLDSSLSPLPGFTDPSQCTAADPTYQPNIASNPNTDDGHSQRGWHCQWIAVHLLRNQNGPLQSALSRIEDRDGDCRDEKSAPGCRTS